LVIHPRKLQIRESGLIDVRGGFPPCGAARKSEPGEHAVDACHDAAHLDDDEADDPDALEDQQPLHGAHQGLRRRDRRPREHDAQQQEETLRHRAGGLDDDE
jgi:hypothetical protein